MVVLIKRKPDRTLEHERKDTIFLKKRKKGQNETKKQNIIAPEKGLE